MKLVVAVLAWLFVSAAPALAVVASQPLTITLSDRGARALSLPAYDPSLPLAVTINDRSTRRGDRLTLIAAGPSGQMIHVPLARVADGTMTGMLRTSDPGRWYLQLVAHAGAIRNETTPIALDVAAPPSNAGAIGFGVGAGIFIVVGGGGFILLRRTVGEPAARELDKAA